MSEAGPGFLSGHERFGRRDAKNWNDLGEICARKTVAVQRATGDTSLSSTYRSSPDSLLDRQPVVSPWQPPLASARSQTEDEEKQDHFLVWITAPIQSPLNLVDLACRGAIWLFTPSPEPAGARQHSSASPSQANPPGTVVAALRAGGAWEIRNTRGGDRAFLAVCLLTCGLTCFWRLNAGMAAENTFSWTERRWMVGGVARAMLTRIELIFACSLYRLAVPQETYRIQGIHCMLD
jgi:hypothetical protein